MKFEPNKEKQWINLLDEFSKLDSTVSKFCETHEVTVPQYYYWKNRIKERKSIITTKKSAFIKVNEVEQEEAQQDGMSIEVNSIKINIPVNFNTINLKKLIKVVQTID